MPVVGHRHQASGSVATQSTFTTGPPVTADYATAATDRAYALRGRDEEQVVVAIDH